MKYASLCRDQYHEFLDQPLKQQTEKHSFLAETLPAFANELQELLIEKGEPALAAAGAILDHLRPLPLRRRRLLRYLLHAA